MTRKILLIEDSLTIGKRIQILLQQWETEQFEICHVLTLDNGIIAMNNDTFECIFLDLVLPDSQGIQTLENLLPHSKQVPIIVLTSINNESTAIKALNLGAQDYLIKAELSSKILVSSFKYAIEREELRQQLISAKNVAENAKKAEEIFLANMSHEIRTPLNAILGFTNLMLNLDGGQQFKTYLQKVKVSSELLQAVIGDVLDYSKIQNENLIFQEVDFNLNELINDIIDMHRFSLKNRPIELITNFSGDEVLCITSDPTRIKQVISNLISNAIKFTERGEITINICIHLEGTEPILEMLVEDTGIGIRKERQEEIFEKFKQAENDTTRKYGGTGLGLAIVKRIVEAGNGKITLKSEVGKGSLFKVILPVKICNQKLSSVKKNQDCSWLGNYKILIVEDNEMNQDFMGEVFKSWSANFTIAGNGHIAMDLFKKNCYDLVLMDIQMPVLDGYETTRRIRNLKDVKKANAIIIALTASVATEQRELCLMTGMNDFIAKPVNQDKLLMKLEHYLLQNTVTNPISLAHKSAEKVVYSADEIFALYGQNDTYRNKMFNMFLDRLPRVINDTSVAVTAENTDSIRAIIHKFRSSVDFVGSPAMADLTEKIEILCKRGEFTQELSEMLEEFYELSKQLEIELKKIIA